jgi:hypothetical protein
MSDPFQKQFGLTMVESGLLMTSTMCDPQVHPATRIAKLKEWHKHHIKSLEEYYIKTR